MALAEVPHPEHEPEPLDKYELRAQKHYSDLPYHNFEHAREVVVRADKLAQAAMAEGILVNRQVIRLAALFHDTGYRRDASAMGFTSKEEYSAHIARTELADMQVDEETIILVERCIMATLKDTIAETAEEKIVRLADIYNIGTDYDSFEAGTIKLKEEYEAMNVVSITMPEFKEKQGPILASYLEQDLSLTDADRAWRAQAQSNFERYKEAA